MDRGGGSRRDERAGAVGRLDPPVARVAAPLERERPVKTPEMDARFKALGAERLRDPEYQRYAQGFRSHDSLSEAGKVGYRVTGEKHGWEFVHDKIADARRDNPSDAEQRMIGLLAEAGERDARGGGMPGHVYEREYKVAPFTHVDFAWPESGKIIEVYGGVHLIPELDPDGTRAAYDAARIERIEGLGWEVLVVTSDDLTPANRGEAAAAIRAFLQDTSHGRIDFSPADAATLDAIFASPDRDDQDKVLAAAGYERFDPDRLAALVQGERTSIEGEMREALAARLSGRGPEAGLTLDATAIARGRDIQVDGPEAHDLATVYSALVTDARQMSPPDLTRKDAAIGRDWQASLAEDARTMADLSRDGIAGEGREPTDAERTLWTQLEAEARAHEGTALRFDVLADQLGDRAVALAEARNAAERARAVAQDAHRHNDPDTPDREDEADAAERTLQTLLESEERAHEGATPHTGALANQLAERENLAVRERYAAADMALLERLERDKPAFVETVTADLLRRRGAPSVESLAPEDRLQLRADLAEEMGVRQEAAHFIALDITELQSLEATYQELALDRGNGPIALADASAARDAASLSRETAAFERDEARWAAQRGGPGDEREVASFLAGAEEWDRTAARFEGLERQLAPSPVDAGEARMLEDAYHGLAEERGHDLPGPLNAYMAMRGADMSRETAMDYRTAAAFEVRQAPPGQPLDQIGREAVTHWRAEADRYDAQAVRFDVLAAQLDERMRAGWVPAYSGPGTGPTLSFATPPDVF